jgi:hypothetical protein
LQEVLKRDVIEGEKADEARKRVARASHKRKAKPTVDDVAPLVAGAVASGQ